MSPGEDLRHTEQATTTTTKQQQENVQLVFIKGVAAVYTFYF